MEQQSERRRRGGGGAEGGGRERRPTCAHARTYGMEGGGSEAGTTGCTHIHELLPAGTRRRWHTGTRARLGRTGLGPAAAARRPLRCTRHPALWPTPPHARVGVASPPQRHTHTHTHAVHTAPSAAPPAVCSASAPPRAPRPTSPAAPASCGSGPRGLVPARRPSPHWCDT